MFCGNILEGGGKEGLHCFYMKLAENKPPKQIWNNFKEIFCGKNGKTISYGYL